jgi:NTP pyrophosphatase (non-canonical NTP hydrolase)
MDREAANRGIAMQEAGRIDCPKCGNSDREKLKLTESRNREGGKRRTYRCQSCFLTFRTMERVPVDTEPKPKRKPNRKKAKSMSLPHNGLIKLMEECGELTQVCAKAITADIDKIGDRHYDGKSIRERLIEELADVRAALTIVESEFQISGHDMHERMESKVKLFRRWQGEHEATNQRNYAPAPVGLCSNPPREGHRK